MKYERAKSDPVTNIIYLKMATLASKEHDTELTLFRKTQPICKLQTNKPNQRALFCTEVQGNEFMCVQVQMLLSSIALKLSPLNKLDHTSHH